MVDLVRVLKMIGRVALIHHSSRVHDQEFLLLGADVLLDDLGWGQVLPLEIVVSRGGSSSIIVDAVDHVVVHQRHPIKTTPRFASRSPCLGVLRACRAADIPVVSLGI